MKKLYLPLLLSTASFALTLSTPSYNKQLVIYNNNIALVQENKKCTITPKDTTLVYTDVAPTIIPNSVHVSFTKPLQLYTQQYRYDKLTSKKLLEYFIGKQIQYKQHTFTLLSYYGAEAIVKNEKGQLQTIAIKDITYPQLPKRLIIKPSLVWNIQTRKTIHQKIALDYLVKNIQWSSDYILNLHKNNADLLGWITIDNKSGKAFVNTQLKLLAGDINIARNTHRTTPVYLKATLQEDSMPRVTQTPLEGYHLYTIPFKVTLQNNEKTQIKYLEKKTIPITRTYSAHLQNPLYLRGESSVSVNQSITINPLNIVLAKGIIRTYATDHGEKVFLGEHRCNHTPKNTPIQLNIGKNFDLKVKQTLLANHSTKQFYNIDMKYTITNNANDHKKVTLYIPFNKKDASKILTDKPYRFTKGNLATFTLDIAPSSRLSFTVNFQSKR